MSHGKISSRRPKADESLMSFLRWSQDDACYSENGFEALVSGASIPDSRLAERRDLDWDLLSRFFNASADELFGLSERSLYYEKDESGRLLTLHQRAPWLSAKGYGPHCPCCLKESEHWRKSWMQPGAIVCSQHGNVLIRHCCGCGGDLSGMIWRKPTPCCPTCQTHLSFSPVIKAPSVLAYRASVLGGELAELFQGGPIDWEDRRLARAATVWRATRILNAEPQFVAMCATFCGSTDLGAYDTQRTVEGMANRYAQSYIVAHFMAELDPTLTEHCWLSAATPAEAKKADESVLLKLSEITDAVSLQQTRTIARGQLTMSFASCEGEWTMPSAA